MELLGPLGPGVYPGVRLRPRRQAFPALGHFAHPSHTGARELVSSVEKKNNHHHHHDLLWLDAAETGSALARMVSSQQAWIALLIWGWRIYNIGFGSGFIKFSEK